MRIWIKLLGITIVISILVAACASKDNNDSSQQQVRTQQTVPEQDHLNDVTLATHLEQIAEAVPDVRDANVVVIGKTAIVGIDVDGNLDRSRVGTLKYSVAEALRKDPHGAGAIVTADLDINARLKEIATDIKNGKPVSGFLNELGDMVGRIMPQLPSDLIPREQQAPNTSEDKEKLEEEQL